MSMSTTHKQAELLSYLEHYISDNGGIAPSFEEMMDALDLASKSGVYRLLDGLEERGKIARIRNRSRCIRILPENMFEGIPTSVLIGELSRRSSEASAARRAG